MTSKERVLNTLEFKGVDKLAKDIWILPAVRMEYGDEIVDKFLEEYKPDIIQISGPFDHGFTPEYYQIGHYIDPWKSEWVNIQAGIIGEVKKPIFSDYDNMDGYVSPKEQFIKEFKSNKEKIANQIKEKRNQGKFIIGGWISLFERLQFLRGTEDVYCDIALEEPNLFKMINLVMDFMRTYVNKWLEMDIDAVAFGDDWGTQLSLLISPSTWKKIFRPLYKELIDMIKSAGKKVFFHSDGYIWDLYPEFIELGVDAINSQLWCMGIEKVAKQYSGKITFWGEISRQTILPNGKPEEVVQAAEKMKKLFFKNGGGFIGQSEINRDVPLKNIEAFIHSWD